MFKKYCNTDILADNSCLVFMPLPGWALVIDRREPSLLNWPPRWLDVNSFAVYSEQYLFTGDASFALNLIAIPLKHN